jgi:hypothetical protein
MRQSPPISRFRIIGPQFGHVSQMEFIKFSRYHHIEAKIQGCPGNGSSLPQEMHAFSSPAILWFFKEYFQLFGTRQKAKLLERLGLDLADALPRDVKVPPNLLERLLDSGADAKALAENPLFAGG